MQEAGYLRRQPCEDGCRDARGGAGREAGRGEDLLQPVRRSDAAKRRMHALAGRQRRKPSVSARHSGPVRASGLQSHLYKRREQLAGQPEAEFESVAGRCLRRHQRRSDAAIH